MEKNYRTLAGRAKVYDDDRIEFTPYDHTGKTRMVDLVESGSDDLENLLLQGDLHLACLTTSAKNTSLDYLLVAVEQIVLLASRSTALAQRIPSGQEIDISDAKDETFICIRRGHSVRVSQDNLFYTHHIRPKILFESSSIEVAKRQKAIGQLKMLL